MDVFAGFNAGTFALVSFAAVVNTVVPFESRADLGEFVLYSAGIAAAAGLGWLFLRRKRIPAPVLLLMQVGILTHYAGGFVHVQGGRLYDAVFVGLKYDKYVHLLNGTAGAALANEVLRPVRPLAARAVLVALIVMGVGAGVEMIEYVAQLWIPDNGVGGYDNNMRDLFANLAGALLFLGWDASRRWLAAGSAVRGMAR